MFHFCWQHRYALLCLIAEIKRWVADIFKEIRSLFDPIDGKPLTYDEFINMPLRALWDENGQKYNAEWVERG